jgi:hypothetical protein
LIIGLATVGFAIIEFAIFGDKRNIEALWKSDDVDAGWNIVINELTNLDLIRRQIMKVVILEYSDLLFFIYLANIIIQESNIMLMRIIFDFSKMLIK